MPDREARCKSEARNHRPVAAPWQHINLDNDQSGRKSPRLKHPCSVPEQLRRHLSGLGNLTESVIECGIGTASASLWTPALLLFFFFAALYRRARARVWRVPRLVPMLVGC